MAKIHITITANYGIVEQHRKLGTNISQICEAALRAYIEKNSGELIKQAETQLSIAQEVIKDAQSTAAKDSLLSRLLERARKVRATGGNLKKTLDEAEKLSGLPRSELVRKL